MAVETAAMVWKDTKAGPNADSGVEIGICINHSLRLVTATVTLGLIEALAAGLQGIPPTIEDLGASSVARRASPARLP